MLGALHQATHTGSKTPAPGETEVFGGESLRDRAENPWPNESGLSQAR